MQLTRENAATVAEWCDATGYDRYAWGYFQTKVLELDGASEAVEGDYVIRDAQGKYYSCKPDIFNAIYEEVT